MNPTLLALWLCTAPAPGAGETLDLEKAEELALAHHPSVRQAEANLEAARARADAARAPLLPELSLQSSYQRTTANFSPRPGSTPSSITGDGSTSFNTYDWFSAGLSASVLVWDFGKTLGRYRAAQAQAEGQAAGERSSQRQVKASVRSAFFAARARRALFEVTRSRLSNEERHLTQVTGFVEVGTRPSIDLAHARTAVANAKLAFIQAENAYGVARVQLNLAMGLPGASYEVSARAYPTQPGEDGGLEGLLQEALAARPELAALAAQELAQEQTLRAVTGGYWPTLGASTSFNETGRQLDQMAWNWSGQLSLSWPLFQGLSTMALEKEARAARVALSSQRALLEQQVRLEVEQARLSVRAAAAAQAAASEALSSARQQLLLAEGRYATGLGSSIELGDAQLSLSNAEAQQVQVEYELALARSQLVFALGR